MGTRSISGASIAVSLSGTIQNLMDAGSVTASAAIAYTKNATFANGIDPNQADRMWKYTGTILSGRSLVLRLATLPGMDVGAGTGKDALGQAWDAYDIVTIIIGNENAIGDVGWLEITEGYTIPARWIGSHIKVNNGAIGAQGLLVKHSPDDGFPVTPGVSEAIRLFANSGDVDVTVIVLARSLVEDSSGSSSSISSRTSSSSSQSSSKSSVTSSSSKSSRSSVTSSSSSSSSSKSSVTSSSSSSSSNSSSSS